MFKKSVDDPVGTGADCVWTEGPIAAIGGTTTDAVVTSVEKKVKHQKNKNGTVTWIFTTNTHPQMANPMRRITQWPMRTTSRSPVRSSR
jgi:hypothetical protein